MENMTAKFKVALMVIVKAGDTSEFKNLKRMLDSVKDHVDGIYIQLNAPQGVNINPKVRQLVEQYTKNISIYEWTGNFVNARNALMDEVPKKYQWCLWADCDDVFDRPENIRSSLAVMPDNVPGVFILYDYQKDKFGNVIVAHWTTRAVRNDGTYAWKSSFDDEGVSVHETLIAKREVRQIANPDWKVIHMATEQDLRDSLIRNIEILEGMAIKQGKSPQGVDPRILFYLGSHNYDAYNYRDSEKYFIQYLELSGWPEERAEAHIYMGKILLMHDKEKMAKNAFLFALGEYPDNPGAYLGLGKIEASNERWEQAAMWFKRGVDVKRKLTSMVRYNYDWELYSSYTEALAQLGGKNLPTALKMATKSFELRPFDSISKHNRDNVLNLLDHRDDMRAVARLIRKLKDNEKDKILPFLDSLPSSMEDSIVAVDARHEYTPPKKWPKGSIVIYVGQGPMGTWGPWSLEEGIGGSEEAVIRLSRELAKLGWSVTVYATPGEKAGPDIAKYSTHDDDYCTPVEWKHYWQFNHKDEFDVLVNWRQPAFFDYDIKARKRYLWLHDVTPEAEFTPERLKNLDKVIVLSKYHRSIIPNVPDDKIFLSSNGITPEDFNIEPVERNPHRLIYMSSHVRGLALIYAMWPKIKKAVPDAQLDLYYGWESYINVHRNNPERMVWRKQMMDMAESLDGVTDHGKISQTQIVEEIFKSGIWIYPCPFPEISCITGLKAQAGGAIPVSSNFAALDETVQFGVKIPMKAMDEGAAGRWNDKELKKFQWAVIDMLKHPEKQEKLRPKMMKWATEQSWQKVAEGWNHEFN